MERAMKVQDVMLQAMAKKITWWQAAEILGISDRHMRRWRERYVEEGYNGLLDRRRGKPSRRRVPVATVEKVFALYREKYFDLNVQHFHEKLQAEHGIELSYTWVKQALQGAGLVARGRKRGAHRKRRERRPLPGMLLHIDGSRHQWFQDERWYDLIVILDDATARFTTPNWWRRNRRDGDGGTEGSDRAQRRVLRAVQRSGQPFLADAEGGRQGGLSSPHAGGTGVARVGSADDSGLLAASAGRSERNFGTWQGRLPQELRLRQMRTLEAANRFLREALHRRVQPPFSGRAQAAGECFCALPES
jgi:transposase